MKSAIEALERLVKTLRSAPHETFIALLIGLAIYQEMGKQKLQDRKDARELVLLSKIDTLTTKIIVVQDQRHELHKELLRYTEKEREEAQQRVNELLGR